jgi:DNA-binding response OmpR family regulator
MHLLIVEDDMDLGQALLAALRPEGITATWVRSLNRARPWHGNGSFDCVLLDLTLPDGEGLALLKQWRAGGSTLPVVMITARVGLEDRLQGLHAGADDFIVKPFAVAELIARLWAVTRRSARQCSPLWAVGALRIDPRANQAWLREAALDLTAREFRLLLELARDPGKVVSKSALAQRLDPLGEPLDAATVEVHLSNLRRKIGAELVRTVRGVGYQLLQ